MTISTHVLDIASGKPAANLWITLYRYTADAREELARARTDADGRIASPFGGELAAGDYELLFNAGEYFATTNTRSFYTTIPVRFTLSVDTHYHIPLLLSPHGYSTYRGT